jgi:hypothetical protein
MLGNGQIVLGDLVVLGQVRVKILLAVKFAVGRNLAVQR